ncbi:MAG TPA: hypothetical protein VFZ46_03345 [Nitrososphaeraceae archaeon]
MAILECENCGYKFPSKEIELTNVDITNEYFRINWNCPKCNIEGLTMFINNKTVNINNKSNK